MKRRVVVTGIGAVTSLSCKVDDLWQKILRGQSGIHTLQNLRHHRTQGKIRRRHLRLVDRGYIDRKEEKRIDRFTQFAMVAGIDAVNDSGLDFSKEDPFRCGVIFGSGIGGLTRNRNAARTIDHEGPGQSFRVHDSQADGQRGQRPRLDPLRPARPELRSGHRLCKRHQRNGRRVQSDSIRRCRHHGHRRHRSGLHADGPVRLRQHAGPFGAARRSGRREPAVRRRTATASSFPKAPACSCSRSWSTPRSAALGSTPKFSATARAPTPATSRSPMPKDVGAARAMACALRDAKLSPEAIDYINAHGTSTPLGDKAETIAIKTVFGDAGPQGEHLEHQEPAGPSARRERRRGAGHLHEGAAAQHLPADDQLHTPDPDCDLDYTPNTPRERKLRVVMSNSFGFGGHNAYGTAYGPGCVWQSCLEIRSEDRCLCARTRRSWRVASSLCAVLVSCSDCHCIRRRTMD